MPNYDGNIQIKNPQNVKSKRGRIVGDDVHGIAKRIAELSENLLIVETEPKNGKRWLVVEVVYNPARGINEFAPVKRYASLNALVVEDLKRMLALPLEQRIRELDEWEEAAKKAAWDEQVERMAAQGEKAEWAARQDGLIHVPKVAFNDPVKRKAAI